MKKDTPNVETINQLRIKERIWISSELRKLEPHELMSKISMPFPEPPHNDTP